MIGIKGLCQFVEKGMKENSSGISDWQSGEENVQDAPIPCWYALFLAQHPVCMHFEKAIEDGSVLGSLPPMWRTLIDF